MPTATERLKTLRDARRMAHDEAEALWHRAERSRGANRKALLQIQHEWRNIAFRLEQMLKEDEAEMAEAEDEASLSYFNRYIAGDR